VPFKSKKQAAFAHANPEKFGGAERLKEWDSATDFSSLPETKVADHWMADESEREKSAGTKGSFSSAAARAGKSTAEYANEKASAPGKIGRRARMTKTFMAARKG
jgi:hypothetical protein